MLETFRNLDLMLQVYWALAIIASVVFAFQAIMTFVGFDVETNLDVPDDVDSEFDVEGFHLISVKTIVSFVLGFGWTGVLLWNDIENPFLLGALALIVGLIFMSLIAWMLYLVLKLDRDNTFRIQKVVGLNADVYLTIPANKSDTGKITVSINGSMHELEAVTLSSVAISTGSRVKIVGVETGETVLVEMI